MKTLEKMQEISLEEQKEISGGSLEIKPLQIIRDIIRKVVPIYLSM